MASTYTPIATYTATGTPASYTFSSIPSTYTDLVLIGSAARGITGSGSADYNVTFNGDTGSNYSVTLLYESPASTRSSNRANLNWMGAVGDGNNLPSILHFMNYANTTTYKTALGRWGSASDGIVRASVGLWRSTSAINSITITPPNGIANGSTFTLYGIKAA